MEDKILIYVFILGGVVCLFIHELIKFIFEYFEGKKK